MLARFEHAREFGCGLHRHWRLGNSYGGFTAALAKWSGTLVPAIAGRFQRQMQSLAQGKVRGWCALAADGTRQETPHTRANEAGLGCAGREKTAPQVSLTSLWHLGLSLPWDFRNGPGTDSERHHLLDMLPGLPPRSLVVADAGFIGYELCQAIARRQHHFLLRVGGNVTLLTELGDYHQERDGIVYLWPHNLRSKPPLVLRLIQLRDEHKQTIYLVTNVLDASKLSEDDAAVLYELRWGIEVGYRSYKQTLNRRTLKSRTPDACLLESQWTMLGLWLLGLMSASQQAASGGNSARWSTAKARDAVRRALRPPTTPRRGRPYRFAAALRSAVIDSYVRRGSKSARNYPRKKKEKPPGPPKIKPAKPNEVQRAARLKKALALAA